MTDQADTTNSTATSSTKTDPKHPFTLAIDIGGTKLAVGVVRDDGVQLSRARAPTDVALGPDAAVDRLALLCRQVIADARLAVTDVAAVGVGCGGPLDTKRGVTLSPPNLPGWDEYPLVKKLDGSVHFNDLSNILFDQALLAEGGLPDDPAAYVRRVNAWLV